MFESDLMYSNNHHARPLSNEDLQLLAPAVFTETGSVETSNRYTNIPTIQIVEGLRKEGFFPVAAMQSNSRKVNGSLFAKHLVTFRREQDLNVRNTEIPEMLLYNSHNAGSALRIKMGAFRSICSNGCQVGDDLMPERRVLHKGDILGDVIEGVYEVVNELPRLADNIERFKSIQLTGDERRIFADAALALKWERDENGAFPFTPGAALQIRRNEDKAHDLWTTFNVVQENFIRGGMRGFINSDSTNYGYRRTSNRAVKSVDESNRLNSALWTLAEKMAELKTV